MNKVGPIVVIEDDADDQEVLFDIFKRLDYPNQVIFFTDGNSALDYLVSSGEEPFLILSDINMPAIDGFTLRDMVHNNEELRLKCIPYLFFTTSSSQRAIIEAYSKSIQGFFVKPNTFEKIETTIKKIVEYWQECQSPNVIV